MKFARSELETGYKKSFTGDVLLDQCGSIIRGESLSHYIKFRITVRGSDFTFAGPKSTTFLMAQMSDHLCELLEVVGRQTSGVAKLT